MRLLTRGSLSTAQLGLPLRVPTGLGTFLQLFTKTRHMSALKLEAYFVVIKCWKRWTGFGEPSNARMPAVAPVRDANLDSEDTEKVK